MTDQRPQYGELASPEEQRAAAGLPPLDEVGVQATPTGAAGVDSAEISRAPASRPHPIDRFATIGLLAYGLVNVVITALSYLDLPSVMNETMKILGIDGEFTNYAQGRIWGTIAAIVLVLGWAVTAALSIRRLRRGRLTWWVPIVGAIVSMAVVTACISVPMMSDPAFVAYVSTIAP